MANEESGVQDAAMSLFALGQRSSTSSPDENVTKLTSAAFWADGAAASWADDAAVSLADQNMIVDGNPNKQVTVKKARPSPSKYKVKPKDPSRDTSVPFDEMKRLMRVYGSLKCLRNRLPVDSGKAAKAESIKRKFYRWFPDLEERFVRTEDGWYRPKAGHEEEMQYREMMRRGDQDILVMKRTAKRTSTKLYGPPVV